jgi:peptidoglycan/xylan/chitin deacetylase (PgdA/CDA1 family)
MKKVASRLIYRALSLSGVLHLAARRHRKHLRILMYHGVHGGGGHPLDNFDGLELHVDRFAWQMEHLKANYEVVGTDACLDEGSGERPRAVVTFDDAYASVHSLAFPILKRLGLPATVFAPIDFIVGRKAMWWDRLRVAIRQTEAPSIEVSYLGKARILDVSTLEQKKKTLGAMAEDMKLLPDEEREGVIAAVLRASGSGGDVLTGREPMTVAEIQEMAKGGIAFESHGLTHRSLPVLTEDEVWRELTESRAVLEGWTGRPVTWFAYPYGHFDSRTAGLLGKAGYRAAVTTKNGFARRDEPMSLDRLGIGDPISKPQFEGALSGVRGLVASFR